MDTIDGLIYPNGPKPIVSFGSPFSSSPFEKIQENCAIIQTVAVYASEAVMGDGVANHLTSSKLAQVTSSVQTVLAEADNFYLKLSELEQNIVCLMLEGKLKALKSNLKNLQGEITSEDQKLAEIVCAISNLEELLPLFSSDNSIFKEQYYHGACLFLNFCTILKGIALIAEHTAGYDASNLPELKVEYQEVLHWYQRKCIGERLASCYLRMDNGTWNYDWEYQYSCYGSYYDRGTTWLSLAPWLKYGKNLGGNGWRICHHTLGGSFKVVDPWDTRNLDEIEIGCFRRNWRHDKDHPTPYHQMMFELECDRVEVLRLYRDQVKGTMEKFFKQFSIVSDDMDGERTAHRGL